MLERLLGSVGADCDGRAKTLADADDLPEVTIEDPCADRHAVAGASGVFDQRAEVLRQIVSEAIPPTACSLLGRGLQAQPLKRRGPRALYDDPVPEIAHRHSMCRQGGRFNSRPPRPPDLGSLLVLAAVLRHGSWSRPAGVSP